MITQYDSIMISDKECRVKKQVSSSNQKKSLIPDFDVIKTVQTVDTSKKIKQLTCTWSYNNVYGLPCVHSLVVAKCFAPKWSYITHDNVSVRLLKSYYLYFLPEKLKNQTSFRNTIKTGDCWYSYSYSYSWEMLPTYTVPIHEQPIVQTLMGLFLKLLILEHKCHQKMKTVCDNLWKITQMANRGMKMLSHTTHN